MLEKVKAYVNEWQMLQKEDCVIAGVSGGADSICLVFMLLELQKEIGFKMAVVHVNHGLRGEEADEDEAYVKTFCAKFGIPCECYFEDVELFAKNWKQSTEEAGRNVRKACLWKAMEKYGGTKIALAHHQNDSVETFFLNLARGTGLKGLGGIAPVNGVVIRPLLGVQRAEIEAFLQEKGIYYRTDKTNASDLYTRNRIRNHVVPYLESEINPQVVAHMNETMEQIRLIQEYLQGQAEEAKKVCVVKEEKGFLIVKEEFQKVPEAIRPILIRDLLVQISGKEKDLESVHLEKIQGLWEKQTGRKVDLPYKLEAKRTYEGILICKKEVVEDTSLEDTEYDFSKEEVHFKCRNYQINCKTYKKSENNALEKEKNYTKYFDCDIIKGNLCFRTRRTGDYITIHPDGKTQKLKSYFINEKIPQEARDRILLVAEGSHVLWIVGYRRGCAYRVTANTKNILEIRVDEGEDYGRDN